LCFQLVALLALIAVASAGVLPVAQVYHPAPVAALPVVKSLVPHPVVAKAVVDEEYDPHPQYKYAYDVQDSLSGDSKSQVEERDGDVVRGEYSLVDSDGFKRTVQYTADPVNGFNAVVNREPLVKVKAVAVAPAPVYSSYH
ncbi:hypothetical protein KR018_009152, partial [Drosophila ironensis]